MTPRATTNLPDLCPQKTLKQRARLESRALLRPMVLSLSAAVSEALRWERVNDGRQLHRNHAKRGHTNQDLLTGWLFCNT